MERGYSLVQGSELQTRDSTGASLSRKEYLKSAG